MNAFEYRPKVGLFLKKTISTLLQKWNHLKKLKQKKVIQVKIYCK